jgi:hypothetical protein
VVSGIQLRIKDNNDPDFGRDFSFRNVSMNCSSILRLRHPERSRRIKKTGAVETAPGKV